MRRCNITPVKIILFSIHKEINTLNLPDRNFITRLVILHKAGHKWYRARMVHFTDRVDVVERERAPYHSGYRGSLDYR